MIADIHYWLAAHHTKGLSARHLIRALKLFSDIRSFFTASASDWRRAGLSSAQIGGLQQIDWQAVEADLSWAEAGKNRTILTIKDPSYPAILKETAYPPLILYIEGNPAILSETHFAIVGARHASPQGIIDAGLFASRLAQRGFSLVSGLALGIDGACHRAAVAESGKTIAVLGSGLSNLYPRAHIKLAESIKDQGLLISEFPPQTKPLPQHFPQRNRIIAGLSIGVLVIEAALKSGSLITARYGLEYGREIFALPGSIHHRLAKGCHALIKEGAKLVDSYEDIEEEITAWLPMITPIASESVSQKKKNLSGSMQLVYDAVDYAATPYDVIILRSGLTASEVSSILLTLELQGHIQSVMGGYMRINVNLTSD